MNFLSPSQWGGVRHRESLSKLVLVLVGALITSGCAVDLARLPSSKPTQSVSSASAVPPTPRPRINTSRDTQGIVDKPASSSPASVVPVPPSFDNEASATTSAPSLLDINAVNAPVAALIYSLAAESDHQLEMFGQLEGRVTLKLTQVTLKQILEQLSSQVPFSWEQNSPSLRVWSDEAYRASYSVNYLNIHRTTSSSVGLATQVGTMNADDSRGYSIANSSQTNIQNSSEHTFWSSLQSDLDLLMHEAVSSQALESTKHYSINREAGLLSVNAVPEVHRAIQQYLEKLHNSIHRQVLIEATVVEVALSDRFEAGIDWQLLASGLTGLSAAQVLVGAPAVSAESISRVSSPAGLVSFVQKSGIGDITATLSLLESFGNVKILSRPRIIALNNQSSVLKVVDNRVYFTTKVERSQSETASDIVTETEIHTVPVGLVMNVTPQISQDGAVMLNVRPTLSRILGFVNDPNPELALANVQNGVPEIQVREMETMLRVQSGQVVVLGGLMQETTEKDNVRLPGLGNIPLVKHLFSHQLSTKQQTELLVVLRPTLVPLNGSVEP